MAMAETSRNDRFSVSNIDLRRGWRYLQKNLSFSLPSGRIMRIEGANGSGKTSLLRLLAGFLPQGDAKISWDGASLSAASAEHQSRIAWVGHQDGICKQLSALENMQSGLYGGGPVEWENALRYFGLGDVMRLKSDYLSQGQRRKAALARLLLQQDKPLWLLDEPFAHLDQASSLALAGLLQKQADKSGIILFTCHGDAPLNCAETLVLS